MSSQVRKHRAPKGALRRRRARMIRFVLSGQKAPSAKKCIKTDASHVIARQLVRESESTERQKAH